MYLYLYTERREVRATTCEKCVVYEMKEMEKVKPGAGKPPLWSRGNVFASHPVGPGSIPGWVNFLVEVFPQL